MYLIEQIDKTMNLDQGEGFVLEHSPQIFHEAHRSGKDRVRVHNSGGEDYELVKICNDDYRSNYSKMRWKDELFFFDYERYDENLLETIYLPFLQRCTKVVIEEASEYSVVLARLVLLYTDCSLIYNDRRLEWFIDKNDRAVYEAVSPDASDASDENVLIIKKEENVESMDKTFRSMGPIEAFQNVFFLQGAGLYNLEKIKYIEVSMDKDAGIGSILINASRFSQAFMDMGLRLVFTQSMLGHYPTSFLNYFFSINPDSSFVNEENTIHISSVPIITTYFSKHYPPVIKKNIFQERFLNEVEEYIAAVKVDKRVLGVLIRGTDYVLINRNTLRRMASVDAIIPVVEEWMQKYGYEKVFLATEDQNILEDMKEYFGKRMFVISQVRYSVLNMEEMKLLSDMEKESNDEYENTMIDDTVNYLYALHMLAHCEAFICSGLCNGYYLTMDINEDCFEHVGLFKQGEFVINDNEKRR